MIIIDRFEGDIAVLETDSGMESVDRAALPQEAGEGDVLVTENGVYTIDTEATLARRESVKNKFRSLLRRNND